MFDPNLDSHDIAVLDHEVTEQTTATTPPTCSHPREQVMDHAQEILPPPENQTFGFHRIYALRGVKLDEVYSKSDLMRALVRNIPVNEYGMPEHLYRSDLLDPSVFRNSAENLQENAQLLEQMLETARVKLDYDQGFPALPNGLPVWTQFTEEPKDAYQLFTAYLEIEGTRQLTDPLIPDQTHAQQYMFTYFWLFRARAYDLFRATHHARVRENRIIKTENSHFVESERLLSKVVEALKSPEKLQELMSLPPDELVVMFEKLSKVQRVSLGLPAMGAPTQPRSTQIPDVQVTMRQMTKEMRTEQEKPADDLGIMDDIAENPETLAAAQELILRINVKQGDS